MRRWHAETNLLKRRMDADIEKHNRLNFDGSLKEECGCSLGTFRKKRPMDSCSPHTYCPICPRHRLEKKLIRRRTRRIVNRITEAGEYPRMSNGW